MTKQGSTISAHIHQTSLSQLIKDPRSLVSSGCLGGWIYWVSYHMSQQCIQLLCRQIQFNLRIIHHIVSKQTMHDKMLLVAKCCT